MKKGFTLVELIVGMAICSILMLTVGVISRASLGSYDRLTKEAEVYNDLYFGVNLIERSVRRASNVSVVGNTLVTDSINFTNLSYTDAGNQRYRLVYCDATGEHNITRNLTSLGFFPGNLSANNFSVSLDNVTISGSKDSVNFNVLFNVTRRN